MTLLNNLHQAHKERLSRMGGKGSFEEVPISSPSYAPSDERFAQLADDFMAMAGELTALKKQQQIHTALIGKMMTTEADEKPKFGEIIDCVCEYYRVSRNDLMSSRRTADLVMPRQIVCYLGRMLTGMSFPQMGRRLGGRDHTTALHGATKIGKQLETDSTLKDDIDVLGLKVGERVMERRFGSGKQAST